MHAVLQSLADICREQLSEVQGHTAQQGSYRAVAALAAHAGSGAPGSSGHSPPASPSHTASVALANACIAQHDSQQRGSQDRRAASNCRLKAGVHSIAKRTKRAAQLTRLKGTLRRARLPRPVLGAALASPARDSTSAQSAIAANTPAGPEQYSLAAVDHSSGQPKSRNDQRECVSEASQGPQRRAQQASGDLMVNASPSWRTQQSEGSRGSSGYSFSVSGAAERLPEESSPGIRMYSSSDPPATSTKRDEKRPAAGASQGGPTRQDNSISSSRRLAMRGLKAARPRVGGTESACPLANQKSSYMMAGKLRDRSAERRQDRRPKHVVREASSGRALRPSQVTVGRIHPSSTAAEVYSSMPSRCSAGADVCLMLHAGRARHRHAHTVRSSTDRTEREYRRQKALAAELRAKEPRHEQAPPRCISRQTLNSASRSEHYCSSARTYCCLCQRVCSDPVCMILLQDSADASGRRAG